MTSARIDEDSCAAAAERSPAELADLLLAYLQTLGLEGFEQSFKMSENSFLPNRFLAGLPANHLAPDRLIDICRKIRMPHAYEERLSAELGGANAFHFGFEGNGDSGIFKLYLEYGSQLIAAKGRGVESVLLHTAFKWDAADNTRHTVARYTCIPLLEREQMLQRMTRIYSGQSDHPSLGLARHIVDLAAARTTEAMMYLEVHEENNPRMSYDINLHAADLKLADIEAPLRECCRRLAIAPAQFDSLWSNVAPRILGHLSGGLSRDSKDFMSFYYNPFSQ